ncbi:hypothetical protein CDAR_615091 [Caerostris darwini]|uniref:Uncharacterized protein n=1 Tax=Caerostris darwini TaxID=1538125 RepID=A0AAV4T5J4_9ARAC|nr:hypothetical protein CDAR_615091 [Caerostris darwini]
MKAMMHRIEFSARSGLHRSLKTDTAAHKGIDEGQMGGRDWVRTASATGSEDEKFPILEFSSSFANGGIFFLDGIERDMILLVI